MEKLSTINITSSKNKSNSIWDIEEELKKIVELLNNKGYPYAKLQNLRKRDRTLSFSIKFLRFNKENWFMSLPEGFICNSSNSNYPEWQNEIIYKGRFSSTDRKSQTLEMQSLVQSIKDWVKELPKLISYSVVLRPIEYSNTFEAEEILLDELKFNHACSEPLLDDEIDDDEIDDDRECEVFGIKYIYENEEEELTEAIEKLIDSEDCFMFVTEFKHMTD